MKPIDKHEGAKYLRTIKDPVNGMTIQVDVYAVLEAFGVTCQATGHAVKKLLCAGERGKGDRLADLLGADAALSRAIELERSRIGNGGPKSIRKDPEFTVLDDDGPEEPKKDSAAPACLNCGIDYSPVPNAGGEWKCGSCGHRVRIVVVRPPEEESKEESKSTPPPAVFEFMDMIHRSIRDDMKRQAIRKGYDPIACPKCSCFKVVRSKGEWACDCCHERGTISDLVKKDHAPRS
jgi:ribosomal protein L37AE/L43A